jgi:hypothetical protein
MVKNSIGKRNFMQPMGRFKYALKGASLFFLFSLAGEGAGNF